MKHNLTKIPPQHTMPSSSSSSSSSSASSISTGGGECEQQSSRANQRSSSSSSTKSVNFLRQTRTYLVPNLDEFTEEDYSRMFFTEQDRNRIQQDIIDSIAAMRIDSQQSDLCIRGLESMRSNSHSEQAQTSRLQVINAVLDEQDRQWDEHDDIVDHEKVSQASMGHSSSAIEEAITRAAEDSLFAQ